MAESPLVRRVGYSTLTYDVKAARYRDADGKFFPFDEVRKRIDADIDATKARMREHALRAQRGEITVSEWRDLQKAEIKNLHLANVAAAKGGFHDLTQADFGTAGQAIREQYEYLDNRAKIVAADPDYLKSDKFIQVAESYGEAGRTTYEAVKARVDEEAGLTISVNVLEDGVAHCKPKGGLESCQQQTDKSPCPSSEMVRVGKRACGPHCRCFETRFATMEEAEAFLTSGAKSIEPRFYAHGGF